MIIEVNDEILAGYITPQNEVFSNVPTYIKNMAKSINKEYKKIFGIDYFTFIDETDIFTEKLPDAIKKLRDKIAKKYN